MALNPSTHAPGGQPGSRTDCRRPAANHLKRPAGRLPAKGVGRKPPDPAIAILAGKGTSHSWLWFADLLDRNGFFKVAFLDEHDVKRGALDSVDVLAVAGGDTFAMAEALGPEGAQRLSRFIESGGLYIGSCAGAYLPMNSSKKHLNLFNFAGVKITNLRKTLPAAVKSSIKFCTAYGCDYIFHPVREAVSLRLSGAGRSGAAVITAPLYGGPGMMPPEGAAVLATYEGFTDKTDFLVDEATARKTLIGKAAAVRISKGAGCLYLLGPHFEHPAFPEANRLVIDMIRRDARQPSRTAAFSPSRIDIFRGAAKKKLLTDIKRELSNSRIVATGLEIMPIHWLIGAKTYEPEKIRVFLESMWTKITFLERSEVIVTMPGTARRTVATATETTAAIRELKRCIHSRNRSEAPAERLFDLLHKLATAFWDVYFLTRAAKDVAAEHAA